MNIQVANQKGKAESVIASNGIGSPHDIHEGGAAIGTWLSSLEFRRGRESTNWTVPDGRPMSSMGAHGGTCGGLGLGAETTINDIDEVPL
jgi:hypothetical protein